MVCKVPISVGSYGLICVTVYWGLCFPYRASCMPWGPTALSSALWPKSAHASKHLSLEQLCQVFLQVCKFHCYAVLDSLHQCFWLYGPFNCISFQNFSWQLFAFWLCSSDLIPPSLLVLSTVYLFMKVSLSPDVILCGWLGLKYQLAS